MHPNDPRGRPNDPRDPHTARYEPGYRPGNYQEPGYQDYRQPGYPDDRYAQQPGYQDSRYAQQPGYADDRYGQPAYQEPAYAEPRPRKPQGPQVNVGMFAGGVIATAIVTALASWLCAWIIDGIGTRMSQSGVAGVWNPMKQDPYWFAVVAFICALLAGVLWYLLRLGTPSPEQFFTWILGILITAAVVTPLFLSQGWWVSIATAIQHLVIGLPILSLVRMVGARSIEYPQPQ